MTNTLILVWCAIFGLCLGSFANVIVLRDRERKSILTGRSHCPHCHHTLAWYDLLPLLSFLLIGGRCRYCKKRLSWQYPLMEVVTAALTVFAVWYGWVVQGSMTVAIFLTISLLLFLILSVIDIRTFEIPLEYCVAAGLLGALSVLAAGQSTLTVLEGTVAGAGIIAFILYGWKFAFKEEGMGVGDIWVAGAVGATVGFPAILVALMGAVLSGSVIGILLLLSKRRGFHSALPFGPFLFLGLLAALVWGRELIQWYIL